MLSWVSQRFSWGVFRQFIPEPFLNIFKAVWIVFPVLLFRYLVRGRIERRKSEDEESGTKENSSSDKAACRSGAVSVPEPEQESPKSPSCTVEEEGERAVNPDDDYCCEYDSTWDTDFSEDQSEDQSGESGEEDETCPDRTPHRLTHALKSRSYKYERFQSAAKDLQNYRHDYLIKPQQRWYFKANEVTNEHPNLDFYLGKRPSSPDNVYISDFHKSWRGDYDMLESVHSYIQWLFPLQEPGVNPDASILTEQEIEEFCKNETAKKHLLESYKLMLDFYGIELCNEKTGHVRRASNWENRFSNLNRRTHNNLRITRILKCLGTLGFAQYQAPLVYFFLEETLVNQELPKVKDSVLNYFLFAVKDKKQRRSLLKFAFLHFDESEEFVWCPKKIQIKWSRRKASKQSRASERGPIIN